MIVSPYLVPGDGGMRLLESLRKRDVRVRILTNSLASTDMPIVHAGYRHYRTRMLEDGIELYEVRPVLGKPEGSGGSGLKSPSAGQFALHAKVFVLDRERLFIGSMNFDRRSLRLNTEIGVLIESPQLAREVVARFDAIAQPANCYIPTLGSSETAGVRPITWRTEEQGQTVETAIEPAGDPLRAIKVQFLTLLPDRRLALTPSKLAGRVPSVPSYVNFGQRRLSAALAPSRIGASQREHPWRLTFFFPIWRRLQ